MNMEGIARITARIIVRIHAVQYKRNLLYSQFLEIKTNCLKVKRPIEISVSYKGHALKKERVRKCVDFLSHNKV